MKGRSSGRKENGKAARKYLAVLMVALMLLSSVVFMVPGTSMDSEGSQDYVVTYYPNGASTGSVTTADYHGIISTEYNPEYWANSSENLNNASNWVGPSYTATVNCTVNVAAAGSYTIERPSSDYTITGYSVESGSVSSPSVTASSFSFTTTAAAVVIVKLQYTEHKVFAGWTKDVVIIQGNQPYTVEPSDAVGGVINLIPYYVDESSKIYTVHFNVDAWNGAKDVNPVVDGTRVKLPDAPAGDTPFKYWAVGGDPIEGDYYLVDEDHVDTGVITITPVYATSSEYCIVTLHDSRTDTSTQTKALVGDYVPLPNITEKKDNKEFIGWYHADGETYYARYYHVEKIENITLEATWSNTGDKRTVTLANTSTLESYKTIKGAQLSLKDYDWDDYGGLTDWGDNKQTGWESSDGGAVYSGYFTVNNNFTIYAYKTPLMQYKINYGGNTTTAYTRADTTSLTTEGGHLFAGWMIAGSILPGDVVDGSTLSLYATWIEPDIFVKDISADSAGTFQITAPTPYMPLYLGSAKGVLDVSKTGYTQTRGDQRNEDSMYGTIYGFTTSNTYFCGTVELPTGTYRSKVGFAKLNCGNLSESQGDVYLGGDVIMDNFDMKSKSWNGKNGGIGNQRFGLFANGHILIMGTGITNSGLITNTDLIPMTGSTGGLATWQIVGGTYETVLSDPLQEEKMMVFADGREYLTDIATCVIIHSGAYYNLTAGNYRATIGAFNQNDRIDTILSIYMVLKGGMVGSSVNGGNFVSDVHSVPGKLANLAKVNSEMAGGSFIYATGIFLPGDQYEDTATDDMTGTRARARVPDTSTISGGCNQSSKLSGSSHVFVTDNASIFDVQGGGREESSRTSFAYLEISGNSTVRHLACGTIMNAQKNTVKNDTVGSVKISVSGDSKIANVLGAGYDIWYNPTGRTMTSGNITIEMSGGTVGNIFGGGFRGSIGTDDQPDYLHIDITVSGGTVLQNIYGGGSGGVDKVKHRGTDGSDTNVKAADGFINSSGSSNVYGTITVNIEGGTINGSVYGGGMSVPKIYSYKGTTVDTSGDTSIVADVYGPVTVNVSGGTINGSVYGGGKGIEFTYTEDGFVIEDTAKIQLMRSTPNGEGEYLIEIDWFEGDGSTYYYGMIWPKGNNESDEAYAARIVKANSFINKDDYGYSGLYLDFAKVHGDVNVNISGGTIGGSVYGGGANGKVGSYIYGDANNKKEYKGETIVDISGGIIGNVEGSVFGGGLGLEGVMSVEGTRDVFISGGTIKGSVYGGSSVGNDGIDTRDMDGSSKEKNSDAMIVIEEANIVGSIYGGGFKGITWGNTKIYIGYDYWINDDEKYDLKEYDDDSEPKYISVSSIFAGGSISDTPQGDEEEEEENEQAQESNAIVPFTTSLVQGTGEIHIYGNGANGQITITGSLMGSGNSCNTAGETTVTIVDFDNRAEKMAGIHRITNLNMAHSSLNIEGMDTVTGVAGSQSKKMSLFMIDHLYIMYDSAIWISSPVDYIGSLSSFNKDGMSTTISSPSNKIVYNTGVTVYIRSPDIYGNLQYGKVTGNIIMALKEQGSYGAYVLASPTSSGGFVVMKDATYKEADSSRFSDTIKCWFVSGIEKKMATMKLDYKGEDTRSISDVSLDIVKLQNDTIMRYTGATFTTVTTDYSGADFEFVTPGEESASNEFGFIIGYNDGTKDTSTTMYSEYSHYLDLGEGDTWITGTYYHDTKTVVEEPYKGDESSSNRRDVPLVPVNMLVDPSAGTYSLNLVFTGKPSNQTMYLGYLTINLQEIQEIKYMSNDENGDFREYINTMVTNKVEVRIDLYVMGTGDVNVDYTVTLKTENNGGVQSGYTEVIIPTGFIMGKTYLVGTAPKLDDQSQVIVPATQYLKEGSTISVRGYQNQDNTSGWMSTASSASWTLGDGDVQKEVGTLMGTVVSTLRISVTNFEYLDGLMDGQTPSFRLHFTITDKNGVTKDAYIRVMIEKRGEWPVHFVDPLNEITDTINVPNGDYISSSSYRSMGANFTGWYTDENYTNVYDYNIPVTKEMWLYARYSYVVTFDNMDGTSSQMYVEAERTKTLLDENQVPKPTRLGYVFERWCKDASCLAGWDFTYDAITSDTRLYAKWVGEDIAVIFHYNDNVIDYRINTGAGLIYPTVEFGSTFSTIDTTRGKNILEVAKTLTGCTDFIYWQTSTGTPVYSDTVLSAKMVNLGTTGSSGMTEVDLYAVTSEVAFELIMHGYADGEDETGDLSVIVASPKDSLIYPTGGKKQDSFDVYEIVSIGDDTFYKDKLGNLYTRTGNEPNYVYTIAEEYPFKTVENQYKIVGDTYYIWINGNYNTRCEPVADVYFKIGGNPYTMDLENDTYVPSIGDSVPITRTETPADSGDWIDQSDCHWTSNGDGTYTFNWGYAYKTMENAYKIEGASYYIIVDDDLIGLNSALTGYYFKDKYSNHYTGSNGTYAVDSANGYSDWYYEFSFTLNDATRSGYRLVSWHNTHMEEHPLNPSAGITRTMKLFVVNDGDYQRITSEVLETRDQTGKVDYYHTADYSGYASGDRPRIDDPNDAYKITYRAKWAPLDYNVTISGSSHGTIDAFLLGSDGSRTLFTGTRDDIKYGQQIELSYTPSGNYSFVKWNAAGEYTLENPASPSTTLVVRGDCTISVSDVGDRVVKVYIYYDDGTLNETDKEKTNVFIYNRYTQEYIPMRYVSSQDGMEVYREYIPLSRSDDEKYDVYIRYGTAEEYEQYYLKGDPFKVETSNTLEFSYHVISARIVSSIEYEEDGVLKKDYTTIPEGYTYDVTEDPSKNIYPTIIMDSEGHPVVQVSKYVGASDAFLNSHTEEFITNNPENGIPPVYIDIAPGYEFVTYEGFPNEEKGIVFNLKEEYNYHVGVSDIGSSRNQFDLNWTETGKPAYIIVKLTPIEYNINYQYDSSSASGEVAYRNALAPSSEVLTELGNPTDIAGWYYDQAKTDMVLDGNILDFNTIPKIKPAPSSVLNYTHVEGSVYKDQYGNLYTQTAQDVYTLKERHVFKSVENMYKIENAQWKMYVVDHWVDCDEVTGYYYRDQNGDISNVPVQDSNMFKVVENEYKIVGETYYVKVGSNWHATDTLYNYYFKDDAGNRYTLSDDTYTCIRISSSYAKLYARQTQSEIQTINVKVLTQGLDETYGEYSSVSFILESDAGNNYYEGTIPMTDIPGFNPLGSTSILQDMTVPGGFTGTAQYKLVKSGEDLTGIYIKIGYSDLNSYVGTLWTGVKFDRKTATLTYDVNGGTVESGGWPGSTKTAKFGETVSLPAVTKYDHQLENWSSTSGSVDLSDGTYTYTVGAEDTNVTFTAQYEVDSYSLIFITPVGSYRTFGSEGDGIQRLSLTVESGTTILKSDLLGGNVKITVTYPDLTTADYELVKPAEYTFDGFDTWDGSSLVINNNKTIIAEWESDTRTLTFSSDEFSNVSASVSSEPIASGTALNYHVEVTMYILLDEGRTLDVEGTKEASTLNGLDIGRPVKQSGVNGYKWNFFLDRDVDFVVVTAGPSINIMFYVNGVEKTDVSTMVWTVTDIMPSESYRYYKIGEDKYHMDHTPIGSAPEVEYIREYQTVTQGTKTYYIDNFGTWWSKTGEDQYTLYQDRVYAEVDPSEHEYILRGSTWYEKGTDRYGRNIPQFSIVSFGNYEDGPVCWYTDPSYNNLFEPKVTGAYTIYEYNALKDLTLYSYKDRYVVFLHDSDGSLTRKVQLEVENNSIVINEEYSYRKAGYVFIGWAVKDGQGKNVYMYKPGDTIPVASSSGSMDLYAYYLKTAAGNIAYDGQYHDLSVVCATNLGETAVDPSKLTVYYSETTELDEYNYSSAGSTAVIRERDVGEYQMYYYGSVTSSTGAVYVFSGEFDMDIDKLVIYLIAPSKSQEKSNTALSCTDEDIIIFTSAVPENPSASNPMHGISDWIWQNEILSITLRDDEGYETSIAANTVGKTYTGINITYRNEAYASHFDTIIFEGTLTVYEKGSSVYSYGGYR